MMWWLKLRNIALHARLDSGSNHVPRSGDGLSLGRYHAGVAGNPGESCLLLLYCLEVLILRFRQRNLKFYLASFLGFDGPFKMQRTWEGSEASLTWCRAIGIFPSTYVLSSVTLGTSWPIKQSVIFFRVWCKNNKLQEYVHLPDT
jgi:hypothetical protein